MINQNLDFSALHSDVRDAFIGTPEKVLIRSGTRVYKWTGFHCWVRMASRFGGLSLSRRTCGVGLWLTDRRNPKSSPAVWAHLPVTAKRVRAAISENFKNSMQHLLLAELVDDVYAFAGKTMGQREFPEPGLRHVYLSATAVSSGFPT